MGNKPDRALTCLGVIVVGVALMIWSAGSFIRAFGDPGPSIPATVLSRHVNRGQGSVVFERDEAIFSALPLFGGLVVALAAALVLVLRRKALFRA